MRLLLDSVAVVAVLHRPAELALRFTERLFETLHARRVGVVEKSRAGSLRAARGLRAHGRAGRGRSSSRRGTWRSWSAARQETHFVAARRRRPRSSSLYALPLFLQDRWLGGIVLEVPVPSFDDSDRRFLDALASGMAVALDRARLLERERERQREEKERLEAEVTDLRRVVHGSRLAYRSAAMESLLATARKIARTDTTVLITGRERHRQGDVRPHPPRAERPPRESRWWWWTAAPSRPP